MPNTHPHYLYYDVINSVKADKATVEAMTGLLDGTIAYATDTNEFGIYNAVSDVWTWLGVGGGGGSDSLWTSGSAGAYSIKAKNNSAIDAQGAYSLAIGDGTYASGTYSFAQGYQTKAFGQYSHSEGLSTEAYGASSHAEGANTKAIGDNSYAGGSASIASGTQSFAFGVGNKSVGLRSAVLGGNGNTSLGVNSVVLGGVGVSGTFDNTAHVPNLNIKFVQSGTPIINLGVDINGNVVTGTTSTSVAFPTFQRNLSSTLTLLDGESLVVSRYVNAGAYDIILQGDSNLRII